MPWCQNPLCGRQNLSKEEVEYDDLRQVLLCLPCFQAANPQAAAPADILRMIPKNGPMFNGHPVFYELSVNSTDGLRAQLRYRELAFEVRASPDELKTFTKSAMSSLNARREG